MKHDVLLRKKLQIKRVLYHCTFWIFLFLFYISTNNNYNVYYPAIVIYTWKLLAQATCAYIIIYVIVPKFLNEKKYIFFILFSALWLYFTFAFLMVFKYYYLEPKFPLFFKGWPGHIMTITERLCSFKLIFGEIIWLSYPSIIVGFISFNRKQRRLSKIEEEKKSMELKVLKNQLNPHFLFNTLNNLYTLTLKKDNKAPEIIAKLSEILDYILYRCTEDFVSIMKEIELLENYVTLEKLRYNENRLSISFTQEIDKNIQIIPLILLTFVENAFKHGVINETEKASIHLNLKTVNQQIIFTIANTKPQNEASTKVSKQQIGLENVSKQLDLLYPKKHVLEIHESQEWFNVKLTLTV